MSYAERKLLLLTAGRTIIVRPSDLFVRINHEYLSSRSRCDVEYVWIFRVEKTRLLGHGGPFVARGAGMRGLRVASVELHVVLLPKRVERLLFGPEVMMSDTKLLDTAGQTQPVVSQMIHAGLCPCC